MIDIRVRLLNMADTNWTVGADQALLVVVPELLREAATEIEALREEVEAQKAEITAQVADIENGL